MYPFLGERGLCAPDISLLEPLAAALDVSIAELIRGERAARDEDTETAETATRSAVDYFRSEERRKARTRRRRWAVAAAVCAAVLLLAVGLVLRRQGVFYVLDRQSAPDGGARTTVYSRALAAEGFSDERAVSLITKLPDGGEYRVSYGGCDYRGLWWSPDGEKYLLALGGYGGEETYFALTWLTRNAASDLRAYLAMGAAATEIARGAQTDESEVYGGRYAFQQWSRDGDAMLFYYALPAADGETREGYFWYRPETGEVRAVLELTPPEE